jgi:hypothetical protein
VPFSRTRVAPAAEEYKTIGLSLMDEAAHTTDPVLRERLRIDALAAFAAARRLRARNSRAA